MVRALTLLLACQLAGEVLVAAARQVVPGVAFPGPVVGMGLLFAVLVLRRGAGRSLEATGGALLRNLSLLFVPAAVGIVQQGDVLAAFGLPLIVALLASTVLTLVVTVYAFLAVARWTERRRAK
ncbi:MAG: CidA/LrgA family protein [Rhizobiaceae bacterium]|nr:MAG: CidA/LrgA family protein [Rhizobiaceae bacterium]